jgi:hypothetical protein
MRHKLLPNIRINRSAQQLRCCVPVALRAPGPGYAERLCVTKNDRRNKWPS